MRSDKIKMMHKEREIFCIPFPHLGGILGIRYTVTDFQVLRYGNRKPIDYERIFWN